MLPGPSQPARHAAAAGHPPGSLHCPQRSSTTLGTCPIPPAACPPPSPLRPPPDYCLLHCFPCLPAASICASLLLLSISTKRKYRHSALVIGMRSCVLYDCVRFSVSNDMTSGVHSRDSLHNEIELFPESCTTTRPASVLYPLHVFVFLIMCVRGGEAILSVGGVGVPKADARKRPCPAQIPLGQRSLLAWLQGSRHLL